MNQEFAEYIKSHIREYLPEDYQDANVTLEEITKGNDRTLTGLMIRNDGETIAPSIYLEPYEAQFEKGRPLDSIMREIAQIKMDNSIDLPFNAEGIKDYETVKPLLHIRLCDPERNQEYLKGKPYTPCGDLVATYCVQVMESDNGVASAAVTNELLKIWGITRDQLHQDTVMAENARNPVRFYSMEDVMSEIMFSTEPTNLFDRSEPVDTELTPMYVLTNKSKINGAGMLALDGVLDKIGKLVGSDFYVLPSSIHEVLIVPDNGQMRASELEDMVKSINASEVAPKDLLSDKVQFYDREAKTLGRKQEKGLLERLAENKAQVKETAAKMPEERHTAKREPSL